VDPWVHNKDYPLNLWVEYMPKFIDYEPTYQRTIEFI